MAPLKNCSSNLLGSAKNFSVGQIVQAKFNKSWWPAVVITADMCGKDDCAQGYTWVLWFGDHRISKVSHSDLKDFVATYTEQIRPSKMYERALYDTLHEITWRTGKEIPIENRNQLEKFAKLKLKKSLKMPFKSLSEQLEKDLTQMRERNLALKENQNIEVKHKNKEVLEDNCSSLNKPGVCMGCDDPKRDIVAEHPLFHGGLCIHCRPSVMHAFENFDASTFSGYCILCGQGGELLVCDKSGCNRSYCEPCISCFLEDDAFEKLVGTSPWYCFLCVPKANVPQSLIPRESPLMAETTLEFLKPPTFEKLCKNKKFTVLSFDDTGLSVLRELKILLDLYYVVNNGEKNSFNARDEAIKYLGNFIDASKNPQFLKLVPEILIGSSIINSPWREDISDFKSFHELRFQYAMEFVHILHVVKKKNDKVLWLYIAECWAIEPNKEQVSRSFGCMPVVMNLYLGKSYYIWGNTAHMERKCAEIKKTQKHAALKAPPPGTEQAAKDYRIILKKFLAPLKQYFC